MIYNVAFKCTWNDKGFKGVCSQSNYEYNLSKNKPWCMKAPCRTFEGIPGIDNHPCYESILFSEWRFGAGWDHKKDERPRKIKNTGIGKIALLTSVEPEKDESDRRIIGFMKIANIGGGEKEETILYGDPALSLEIDPKLEILFWKYYRNPNAVDKQFWGTGLFRYVSDEVILKLLEDLETTYSGKGFPKDSIQKIEKNIEELEKTSGSPKICSKLHAIKDSKVCKHCGFSNLSMAKFCNECGSKLPMVCGKCHAENAPGSKYCLECGAKLSMDISKSPEPIRDKLLEFGKHLLSQPRDWLFTPHKDAEKLVKEDFNAFLFAVIFDQSIGAEKAWEIPYELKNRMKHLNVKDIANMSQSEIETHFQNPTKLHRFWRTMAGRLKKACLLLNEKYGGEANKLWEDEPDSRILYQRLLEFDGIGQKKASMAVNILFRELKVKIKNKSGIDVSYDEMVKRVFFRTGLIRTLSMNNVIKAARNLHPEYPGELDHPAWYIGRTWCLSSNPKCMDCCLNEICPKNNI